MPNKRWNPLLLRKIIILALVTTFVYLVTIFSYQYRRYSKVKERIKETHAALQLHPSRLDRLLSLYNEADFLFRSYSLDFHPDIYEAYQKKLQQLKIASKNFSVDQLANHSLLKTLSSQGEKKMLLARLAKLHTSVETLLVNASSSADLQNHPRAIQHNYNILQSIENDIEHIRERELVHIRAMEIRSFAMHKKNVEKFELQLTIALTVMLSMILLILFYQFRVTNYERQLLLEKEQAAQIAEEKTNLLANISHEVRTPISALLSIIDLLQRKASQKGEAMHEHFDSALHEIALINNSINDILTFSKLEVNNLEVKNEYFAPLQMLNELISLHSYPARKKGLALTSDIQITPELELYGSVFRLKQIISNLLSNAIKYTNTGTVHLSAKLTDPQEANTLNITVKDTGIGIVTEHQEAIFQQYFRADKANITGGFGLGLYICKQLANQLEGDICVESRVNEGSSFSLTTPILHQRLKEKQIDRYTLKALPTDIRIVCIDDNLVNIFYLKRYFSDFPYVFFFTDPGEALEYTFQHKVDIVITDLHMPIIDGWAILEKVKTCKKETRIFLFTADIAPTHVTDFDRPYAFDVVLNKPLNEHQLVASILNKEASSI